MIIEKTKDVLLMAIMIPLAASGYLVLSLAL